MPIEEHIINNFPYGVIDTIESKDAPDGSASKSLNWLTRGDRIELRGGTQSIGTESATTGSITGVHTAYKPDGTPVIFRKNGQKLEYWVYNTSTSWAETGTNLFGSSAVNDEASFANYSSLAGSQMFVSSPNSGLYKIMVANPGSAVNQSSSIYNFNGKGRIKISQNRMFLWGRNEDPTGMYGSYIDSQKYTFKTGETIGTGDGSTKTFTGTLAISSFPTSTVFAIQAGSPIAATKAITGITAATSAVVTCVAHGFVKGDVVLFSGVLGMTQINGRLGTVIDVGSANSFTVNVDSSAFSAYSSAGAAGKYEVFTDSNNGTLTSNLGGTGTINYATGAISLTFNIAPITGQLVVPEYNREDSLNNGICDFTKSASRTAGQGFVFRQDDEGGKMQFPFSYAGHEFCFHEYRTWDLNITNTDTNATNLPYRARVGLPNWRAGVATSTGIYFVNAIDKTNIKLDNLALNQFSTDIVPTTVSKRVTQERVTLGVVLDNYYFDRAAMAEFGDYILLACRTSDSSTNNRILVYNKLTGSSDWVSASATCFTVVTTGSVSELWFGDAITQNVYRFLYTVTDGDSNIINYYETNSTLLKSTYQKKVRKMLLQGLIAPSQSINVYVSIDNGESLFVGTISGSGTYVDKGSQVSVNLGFGSIGTNTIGGSSNVAIAYNYERALKLAIGKFVQLKFRFEATGVGYVCVSRIRFWDVQLKADRGLTRYT